MVFVYVMLGQIRPWPPQISFGLSQPLKRSVLDCFESIFVQRRPFLRQMLAPSGPAPLAPELLAQLGRMEKKLEEGFRTNTELTETWPAELGQLWDVFSNAACK